MSFPQLNYHQNWLVSGKLSLHNVDIITERDIDEDDDIFKHKDIILKVRHLVKIIVQTLNIQNSNMHSILPMDDDLLASLSNMTALRSSSDMFQQTFIFCFLFSVFVVLYI